INMGNNIIKNSTVGAPVSNAKMVKKIVNKNMPTIERSNGCTKVLSYSSPINRNKIKTNQLAQGSLKLLGGGGGVGTAWLVSILSCGNFLTVLVVGVTIVGVVMDGCGDLYGDVKKWNKYYSRSIKSYNNH
ncbi:hypothetical protein DERP_001503, partial [Dermatophagoides pteronyssinus]